MKSLPIVLGALIIVSCNKSNLPEAPFSLSADESRGTEKVFHWTISKNGATDSVTESLDQMYVTKYNSLTLKIKADGDSFQGVNITSSSPNVVKAEFLEKDQDGTLFYSLSYAGNGESRISVWNGKGVENRTTFTVKGQEIIDLKGVWWKVDDEEFRAKHLWRSTHDRDKYEFNAIAARWDSAKERDWDYVSFNRRHSDEFEYKYYTSSGKEISYEDWASNPEYASWTEEGRNKYSVLFIKNIHPLRFSRLEPENASCRNVRFNGIKFYTTAETIGKNSNSTIDYDAFVEGFGEKNRWESYSGDISGLGEMVVWLSLHPDVRSQTTKLSGSEAMSYMCDMELSCGNEKWISTMYYD